MSSKSTASPRSRSRAPRGGPRAAKAAKAPARSATKSAPRANTKPAEQPAATEAATDVHAHPALRRPAANDRFAAIGAYGFAEVQLPILAALVTEDPLLLIGKGGTGKTFLLNSISEALGLEHRHYNASLIAFDDLVGFPYPDDAKTCVRFLETPATVWGAESVLIDEISRCKPEHQNRLFSLVYERRVQGIRLEKLRYRWAAMNPCGADQDGGEAYLGSEPLDPALADRFATIVSVGDWDQLRDADKKLIADPAGEGRISNDNGALRAELLGWRKAFVDRVERCPRTVIDYAATVTTTLNDAGIRISPRRARLLSRALLAAVLINGECRERDFRAVLNCALPQVAWGEQADEAKVAAAHRLAWDSIFLEGNEKWIHEFALTRDLAAKARLLVATCPDPDTGSIAIEQLLANEPRERAAAFALGAFPAAVAGKLKVGAEGVNDLGRTAGPVLSVAGDIRWQERTSESNTQHPDKTRYYRLLGNLDGARLERARQLLYWGLVNQIVLAEPEQLEAELHASVQVFQGAGR